MDDALLRPPRRAWAPWLPLPYLRTDIGAAVYVNWLAPMQTLQRLVPAPLRVVGRDGQGVLSAVVFRHGHFGPGALGPLRKLAPSPIQSNWRVYVHDPETRLAGVYFLATTINNRFYRAAARLTADNVAMWRPRTSELEAGGTVRVRLAGGQGPDLDGTWQETQPGKGPWSDAFSSWEGMLDHVVPQQRMLATRRGRPVSIELELDIPRQDLRALDGTVASRAATRVVGDAEPWSFYVPRVGLTQHRQRWARRVA